MTTVSNGPSGSTLSQHPKPGCPILRVFCEGWDTTNLNLPTYGPTALQPRLTSLPADFNILRSIRTRIQRRLQIRRQHTVSRSTTNRTRFRL